MYARQKREHRLTRLALTEEKSCYEPSLTVVCISSQAGQQQWLGALDHEMIMHAVLAQLHHGTWVFLLASACFWFYSLLWEEAG